SNEWKPKSAGELLKKSHVLAKAMAGCGHLERWEWERLAPLYAQTTTGAVPLDDFVQQVTNARRAVDWGVGTVRAVYEPTINLFLPFEPLAAGLLDDIVRSSVLLPAGDVVGELFDVSAKSSGVTARVMGIRRQSDIYGLNPGFAVGELEVVTGAPEEIEFSPNKIYALLRAPEDMKPVAGLMTVSEGNTVSHVQLLARNLGIPNAVLSPESINELVSHNGKAVFYAVSPRGSVVMKPSSEMSADEMKLIDAQQRNEERITVPTDHLNLKRLEVISVADLRATDSGKLVGPKAANLGQLKSQFPNRVSSGLAIPFGIFRQHLDQPMPGSDGTYWAFLQATFTKATADRKAGKSDAEIDAYVLARLTTLRDAIKKMTLRPDFSADLKTRFKEVFGGEFGRVAVFVRSDTNMEDLKDFTGAGLNLTVPNVRDAEKLLQAVRDVWASPYTERSYRWRQKYLLNPENVYPSVLLQESINGDKSGVMITTGVASGNPLDTTIAFNRGVGGAVAGQSTESYALAADGSNVLQASSRDAIFTALSKDGGTSRVPTTFHQPILSTSDLAALRAIDGEIRQKLPGAPGIETDGPFDVELGLLNGWVWLFQVRPFVENKAAQSNVFLRDLDPPLAANATVDLSRAL
ncbi:MAG: phosphoenolpyruvate synthase, partial [Candidatus Poribacteria bacterium]|nr:phosphoenolpyruvate synthase [Candidatus Poribacteria bacterium]